jgi:hypothetical protein
MFDQLFRLPRLLARLQNGPLAEERRRFLAHCAEQQMSRQTLREIASYTLLVAKALRLAERPSEVITRIEIEAEAERWVNRQPRPRRTRQGRHLRVRFTGQAVRWLTFLQRLQPSVAVQQPYADHVTQFTDYLLRERGLSPRTVAYDSRTTRQFLAQVEEASLRLEMLTVSQVDELLAKKVRDAGYARTTIQQCPDKQLRSQEYRPESPAFLAV